MKVQYKSRNPGSGIANYEVLEDALILEFAGGQHRYVYNGSKPGPVHLKAMVRLATEGKGLATYVSRHVRDNYAAKIKINTKQINTDQDKQV